MNIYDIGLSIGSGMLGALLLAGIYAALLSIHAIVKDWWTAKRYARKYPKQQWSPVLPTDLPKQDPEQQEEITSSTKKTVPLSSQAVEVQEKLKSRREGFSKISLRPLWQRTGDLPATKPGPHTEAIDITKITGYL